MVKTAGSQAPKDINGCVRTPGFKDHDGLIFVHPISVFVKALSKPLRTFFWVGFHYVLIVCWVSFELLSRYGYAA